jgi:hypothetical protein
MNDMMNTEAEATAVDEGVQAVLPPSARYERRQARKLLIGVSGLTEEQKIERMEQAVAHLNKAIDLMKNPPVVVQAEEVN